MNREARDASKANFGDLTSTLALERSSIFSVKAKHAFLGPGRAIFSCCVLHDSPTISRASVLEKPVRTAVNGRKHCAGPLAPAASVLPLTWTLPLSVFSACASFSSIRISVSAIRPLRTLSTHRMVRSTNPLSIRSNAQYQTRILNPRVFNPIKTSRVIGSFRKFFEKKPGTARLPVEPTTCITF